MNSKRNIIRNFSLTVLATLFVLFSAGCDLEGEMEPRLSLFIGVDVSGSFINSGHFDDSISFLSHYIYAHSSTIAGIT